MSRTVIGLFDEFRQAQVTVTDLERLGIPGDRIGVVVNNASDEYTRWRNEAGHGNVPNATEQGVKIGVATAGLIAILTDLGVPDEQAGYYVEGIRRGGTLMTIASLNDRVEPIIEILNRDGAIDINRRCAYYHETGYRGYNPSAQALSVAELAAERERLRAADVAPTPSVVPTAGSVAQEARAGVAPVPMSGRHMPVPPNAVIPQRRPENHKNEVVNNSNGETVLPVVEETLAVGKREVERGGGRVFIRVTHLLVEESVQLRDEHRTSGRALEGTPDPPGVVEKVSDVTGDRIDDKTGKVVR